MSRHPAQGAKSSDQIARKFYNLPMPAGLIRIFPLALALAGLLPTSPANAQRAIAPESQASSETSDQTPSETSDRTTAGHEMKQPAEENLATIVQSRSTNSRGYKVVIHNDGSATAEIDAFRTEPPRSQEFPPGTIDTKTLRRLLTEVGDVSRIPIGNCAKSVSFGTRTQIAYAGKTSGDLQCLRPQASEGDQTSRPAWEDLSRFVRTTLGQLKITR